MNRGRARTFLIFLGLFAASRVTFHLAGLRFSTEHVTTMMHFVDVELLRHRLLESLLHLHGQPPLMPLVMGIILKTSGNAYPVVMQALFLTIGAGTGLVLAGLLLRLGFSPGISLTASCLFTLLPDCLVFENYFFFTYPLILLLLVSSSILLEAFRRQRFGTWLGFFLIAAVIVNFKNLFHLAWLGLLLGIALAGSPRERYRTVLLAFLVPFVLGAGWYVKNWIEFDRFQSSSWMGFGLARKTYHRFPPAMREALIRAGVLDPIVGVSVYGGVRDYAAVLGWPRSTGIEVLDRAEKSSGWNNYHHAIYLTACRKMEVEAWKVIRHSPRFYFQDVGEAVELLFRPGVEWRPVGTPRGQIRAYCDWINGFLYARLGPYGLCPWMLAWVLVFARLITRLVPFLFRGRSMDPDDRLFVSMAITIAYVYGVGTFLDSGETNRYRLIADGLLLVCAMLATRRLAASFRKGSKRVLPGPLRRRGPRRESETMGEA